MAFGHLEPRRYQPLGHRHAGGAKQVLGDVLTGQNVVSAAVLLDMGGNDTYGVMQTPDADAHCTSDPLIRRILTEGAGLVGVGILRDLSGNDTYTGTSGVDDFNLSQGGKDTASGLDGNDIFETGGAALRGRQARRR